MQCPGPARNGQKDRAPRNGQKASVALLDTIAFRPDSVLAGSPSKDLMCDFFCSPRRSHAVDLTQTVAKWQFHVTTALQPQLPQLHFQLLGVTWNATAWPTFQQFDFHFCHASSQAR